MKAQHEYYDLDPNNFGTIKILIFLINLGCMSGNKYPLKGAYAIILSPNI